MVILDLDKAWRETREELLTNFSLPPSPPPPSLPTGHFHSRNDEATFDCGVTIYIYSRTNSIQRATYSLPSPQGGGSLNKTKDSGIASRNFKPDEEDVCISIKRPNALSRSLSREPRSRAPLLPPPPPPLFASRPKPVRATPISRSVWDPDYKGGLIPPPIYKRLLYTASRMSR